MPNGGNMEYQDKSLSIISDANILTSQDWADLTGLKDELKDTFLHTQIFRTDTESIVSVLNDLHHPTPDAKYWQSQREQNVHYQELVFLSFDYRKNMVEIRQLQKQLKDETDEDKAELLQIEIERKQYIAIDQQRVAKDRIREIKMWSKRKSEVIPNMKYSLTNCDEHQLVSYCLEFVRQAQMVNDTTAPADRANIVGKMVTTVRECKNRGILGKVTAQLDEKSVNFISNVQQNLLIESK